MAHHTIKAAPTRKPQTKHEQARHGYLGLAADVAYKDEIRAKLMEMSAVSEDLAYKLLRKEIFRVVNATCDGSFNNSPYGNLQFHDELIELCKSCNQDTTELSRAINAAKDAMMHLKHVTDKERCNLCNAIDSKRLRSKGEDLT